MMVPMELREIQIVDDPMQSQIVILGEREGSRAFPIFIGLQEAAAMDSAARNLVQQRPMTHDLIMNVIEEMNGDLVEIQIDDLRDNTFYGKLVIQTENDERVLVDSRPSDALVLAMKTRVPVYVEEEILNTVCRHDNELPDDDEIDYGESMDSE